MSAHPKPSPPAAAPESGDPVEQALYAKREHVYPREVHGRFARWRVLMVGITLGIYYGLPWIDWGDGRQAFLIDLPGRKFNLFFWTFWPQDLFYLTAILVIAALSLFLFTAVAGRLWCGYTCPQTVWTEVFLWIERRIEGDRPRQMRLAAAPWNREKILRKGAKHLVWIAFSLWTGFTFVGYFTPIRELAVAVPQLALGPWQTFWILFYGFATYGNAGFLREQVCIYMCPYARFQSVMFDRDTLVISYDRARGEPRGPRRRTDGPRAKGLGDCIDCTLCVQVCPTGIDIRNGLQYECISCGACIDVCDSVMAKMGYPKGLIRYTTQNELDHGRRRRILRPRVLVYGAALALITGALLAAVLTRVPLELDVLRDRNALYRQTPQGWIENVYTLKVLNMDTQRHVYRVRAEGLPGLELVLERAPLVAEAGAVVEVPVRLRVPPGTALRHSQAVHFELQAEDDPRLRVRGETRFLGPAP
jgi:cytochrome c oxidase accessory protein FixG